MLRPRLLENICLAEFLSNYEKDRKPDENDSQPVELTDEILNENHLTVLSLPKKLKLQNNEIMKLRKVRKVLRFYVPNQTKFPEKFAHHLLVLYKPFRKEVELATDDSYVQTLQDQIVLQLVNENKQKFEPYSEFLNEALLNFHDVLRPDPILDYEDDETEVEIQRQDNDIEDDVEDNNTEPGIHYEPAVRPSVLPDIDVNESVRSLNSQQREIFETIHKWAKQHLKYQNCINPRKVEPLHLFVTGNAGTGKSFLLNLLHNHLTKLYSYKNPGKVKVLKLAPTGVAAIKINGQTFYSALSIPCKCKPNVLPQLSSKKRDELRHRFSELQVIMIDEISMVSQQDLEFISQRLNEIFNCPPLSTIFANLTVIASGDFLQLPPVNGLRVYDDNKRNPMLSIDKVWNYFKMAELIEVVRQKDDMFVNLLNNCRIGSVTDDDIQVLNSRHVDNLSENEYPEYAMHLFAENKFALKHNEELLTKNPNKLHVIPAIDKIPKEIENFKTLIANQTQMSTGGLATVLKIAIGSQTMITQNISVADHICNGQVGVIKHIKFRNDLSSRPQVIYVKLDDDNAGLDARRTDAYAMENNCVPIKESQSSINFGNVIFQRKQFPLMLANACSVHKMQGQEIAQGVISFNLNKQRRFNPGQMYVALSRIQSLDGLYINGNITKEAIYPDKLAISEYNRLREEALFVTVERFDRTDLNFVFTHLNVRSFNRHYKDIECDFILSNCDLLLLSETQILEGSDHVSTLNGFEVYFQNNNDKFCSIAVCYKPEILFEVEYSLSGAIVFTMCKPSFNAIKIKFLFMYRKKEMSLHDFVYVICHCLSYCKNIDVILGDLNFNYFEIPDYVNDAFLDFEQVISEPTQISGGLLDQIYIN
ncbi:MAG: AAA family ATPase, partial [Nitrosopumilus sp.]